MVGFCFFAMRANATNSCSRWLEGTPVTFKSETHKKRWLNRASANAKSEGNIRLALKYLYELVRISPEDPIAHTQIAYLYRVMNQYDKALEHYNKTLALEGPTSRNLLNILVTALRSHNWPLAVRVSDEARELYPNDSRFQGIRSQAMSAMRRSQKTAATTDESLARDLQAQALQIIQDPAPSLRLGGLLDPYSRPRYREAIKIFSQGDTEMADILLMTELAQHEIVLWLRTQIKLSRGDFAGAQNVLQTMIDPKALKKDLWEILALLKIEQAANLAPGRTSEMILQGLSADQATRMSKLARKLEWNFIVQQIQDDLWNASSATSE